MKINYKGKEVNVSLAMSQVGEDTPVSIRLFQQRLDEEGRLIDETVASKVISKAISDQNDLAFIEHVKTLLENYINLKG